MRKSEAINIVFENVFGWTTATPSSLEISIGVVEALTKAGMLPPCNKGGNYDWDSEPVCTTDTQQP